MIITWCNIKNYRSLRDVTISGMATSNVFHGENNTGKSNVLLALQTIFSRKIARAPFDVDSGDSERILSRKSQFWQGTIRAYGDSFYMGSNAPIEFEVHVTIPRNVLAIDVAKRELVQTLVKQGHDYKLRLRGRIERNDSDGEMFLEEMTLNQKTMFDRGGGDEVTWFPALKWSDEDKQSIANDVLDLLSDSVTVIPASRYLRTEKVDDEPSGLSSESFKNWLYRKSVSRDGYPLFRQIATWFNESRLEWGEISFCIEEDRINIMVEKDSGYRMPAELKGSGVQQILVLLSYIAASSAKVVCVEEPELNLSYRNQNIMVSILRELAQMEDTAPCQLLLTSHSNNIGRRGDLKRFHVDWTEAEGTTIRKFNGTDQANLFPTRPTLYTI